MNQPTISVIVPIYGVEKYIERCARSLFEQSIADRCDYIFVNDCTRDRSIEVLQKVIADYPELQTKILCHTQNRGLAAARNTGLAAASGCYIAHCDSDDYVDSDMLESLYREAEENGSDLVWCDYWSTMIDREDRISQQCHPDGIASIRAIMAGELHGSVCNKFARRSLYIDNDIRFPEGLDVWEDVATTVRLLACATKVGYLPRAFYHYVQYNTGAYTREISLKRCEQQIANVEGIVEFLTERGVMDRFEDVVGCLKLRSKLLLLYSYDRERYGLWRSTFPEATKSISKSHLGLRLELLQQAAAYHQDWFLRLNEFLRRCKRRII